MKTTGNYGLRKPDGDETINIDDLNFNADVIDKNLKSVESQSADNTQQLATKMEKQIKDDSTTKKYEMGIKGGLLY